MINISLPDGSVRAFDKPVSGAEIAASIGAVVGNLVGYFFEGGRKS